MDDKPLFERFACAPGMKLEAHERLMDVHLANIRSQIEAIELLLERLEKRLWLMVYGIVALVMTAGVATLFERITI